MSDCIINVGIFFVNFDESIPNVHRKGRVMIFKERLTGFSIFCIALNSNIIFFLSVHIFLQKSKEKMACWGIVKFCKEEAVEVVPISWYVEDSKECFWPPSSTKKSKIVQLIETGSEPESGWGIYPAVLLAKYDDLNIAKKKAQKAVFTSDLSSNSESLAKGRGFRKSKKNPKYRVDDHSSDEEIESSDDEEFPSMPRNALGTKCCNKKMDIHHIT